jgi:hypothetical protein
MLHESGEFSQVVEIDSHMITIKAQIDSLHGRLHIGKRIKVLSKLI